MACAGRNIPQDLSSCDNLTAVAARKVPLTATAATQSLLPTPPNSISPGLQPHGLKAQLQRARLEPIDSDLDLLDNTNNDGSESPIDPSCDISALRLSQHYLPEILLNHGPLAIRHIMGYLTTAVPGFSAIPPTKARRLVVAALENYNETTPHQDIVYEKVGWGRWDARRRGQQYAIPRIPPIPMKGAHGNAASQGIPIAGGFNTCRRGKTFTSSNGTDSIVFSHDDRTMSIMDHEADKMSLDGSGSASCSEAPDEDDMMDDEDDVTDDEDWAAVGAAALRAESYSTSFTSRMGYAASPNLGSAAGMRAFPASFGGGMARLPQSSRVDYRALEAASGAEEREAVEALLKLRSV
ncbi:DNA-binding proteins Bright/BRCAA1/RBP1 and proteins containing BRIGHT domain [Ceratocystis pirilliformis]|uniref:DNA-binding proteins Bright/BRCAA1/RBP1 and proteins containing BRIGHT domain n=1 Tax=Ceratocystis pirilliformis TaxID=259994 RepID=A0ABR3Z937_9PEZI